MCGIIGVIGNGEASPLLLDGLKRLAYRGYDSAGIATIVNGHIDRRRAEGKIDNLAALLDDDPLSGVVGIGHTRWATHGRPSEVNAHPHLIGGVAVVHNGIIENHLSLRARLKERGAKILSDTDTEIVAHLIDQQVREGLDIEAAVRKALSEVHGAYALAVLSEAEPDRLVVAKSASPLVLGIGDGWLKADGETIYRATDLRVGLFKQAASA